MSVRRLWYLASILLFFFSFPPFVTGFLAYGALIPFFFLIESDGFQHGFRNGYGLGLLTLGCFLYWLNANSGANQLQATGMYLGTIMYLALYWGLYGFLQSWLGRRFGVRSLWFAPILWTAIDYLQSLGELGFTWHSLATTQTYYRPWIQFIEFTGMYGLTFWIVTLNVVLFFLIRAWRERSHRTGFRFAWMWIAVFLAPLTAYFFTTTPPAVGEIRISIIQPNIEPNQKWLEHDFAYQEMMRLTREVPDSTRLVIWPETAIPVRLRQDNRRMLDIRTLLKEKDLWLLTGIPDRRLIPIDASRQQAAYYNAIFLIGPDSSPIISYDKMHLVPFGEFVPTFLSLLRKLAMEVGASNYSPGDSMVVFQLPTTSPTRLSGVVCLESVFPQIVRDARERGAQALVIVTNDAWYDGTPAPIQHARIAILRAVEQRMAVARCANSGVSALVAPDGEWIDATSNGVQAILSGRLPLTEYRTFYSRFGDWLPIGLLLITVVIVGTMAAEKFRRG